MIHLCTVRGSLVVIGFIITVVSTFLSGLAWGRVSATRAFWKHMHNVGSKITRKG